MTTAPTTAAAAAIAARTHRRGLRRWTFVTVGGGRLSGTNDAASGPNARSIAAAVGRPAGSFSKAAAIVVTSARGKASDGGGAGSGVAVTMAWSVANNESVRNGCFPYAISYRTIPSENTSE